MKKGTVIALMAAAAFIAVGAMVSGKGRVES